VKLELTSTKTNPLIGRREVMFRVVEPSTPNRSSVKVELATALRVNLDQVYVKEMETRSGTHVTLGVAHVYDDPAVALRVEPKHIIRRNTPEAKAEAEKEAA
jgi:ribosomal protein S24E